MRHAWVVWLALVLGADAGAALAQARVVSGRVTDAVTGEPIGSGQVTVRGTAIQERLGQDGAFSVSVPAGDVTLVIRSVGYKSVEVRVPGAQPSPSVNVQLERDILRLEEVVVTGQATGIERRNLANAVATVTLEEMERAPTETLQKALIGKVPGANIQSNANLPGGGMQIQLRGVVSLINRSPLYVVDGVIASDAAINSNIDQITEASRGSNPSREQDQPVNRISDLNPADIATIEILKGASASAIYGSKASNGVVIITTKRGQAGRPRVEFAQRLGFFDMDKTLTREFTSEQEIRDAFSGTLEDFAVQQFRQNPNGNWEEDLAGHHPLSWESSLNVSGGGENTRYFASALWKDDDGIMENTGFDKQSVRLNLDQSFGDRLTASLNTNVVRTFAQRGISGNDNNGSSPYFAGAFTPRFIDLRRRPDGTYPENPFILSNPLQTLGLMKNDEEVWRFIGSARLAFDAVASDRHNLRFVGVGGFDRFSQENEILFPPEMQFEDDDGLPGTSLLSNSNVELLNLSGNLVYTYTPSGRVTATTSAGLQYDTRDLNIGRIMGRNLPSGQANVDQAAVVQVEEDRSRREDFGLYIQEEVLLDDRLLLTAGVRADQTSSVTEDDKLFYYPKAAVSYRFPVGGVFDELKLRAAYGESGNQPEFGQKFTPLEAGVRMEGISGFQVKGQVAGTIKPERQRELEGGVDITFSDSRASLELTGYRRTVSDLLLTRRLAPSTGFAEEVFNGGSMRVVGVEAGLTLAPVLTRDVTWVVRSTFGMNRSKILELPFEGCEQDTEPRCGFIPAPGNAGFVFGPSIGAFFIQEGESATQIIGNVPQPGGGGALGKVGDTNPDFRMGLGNDLTIGDFNVFFLWDWQQGSDVLNIARLIFDIGQNTKDCKGLPNAPDNPCFQRLSTFSTDLRSTYLEDATFLKLREISLSWNLPQSFVQGIWGDLRRARLTLSGRNVLTFTGYTGFDPEVSNFGSQEIGRNVDVLAPPRMRSFWFGLDLSF